METSASTGGPQVVSMATSAASNTYQNNKAGTRNHDDPYYVPYPHKPAPRHISSRIYRERGRWNGNKEDSEQSGGQKICPRNTDKWMWERERESCRWCDTAARGQLQVNAYRTQSCDTVKLIRRSSREFNLLKASLQNLLEARQMNSWFLLGNPCSVGTVSSVMLWIYLDKYVWL